MNPMKYPQSYLALEAAQFDRQPRMAPPLTWDDREAQQIPSYEQTAISPDPLIDLGAGFSGGFGANIMRKGLSSALRSGIAATLAEYPIGLATAGAANIDPRLAMPVSLLGGMASGPTFERALSNAMAGKGHPLNARRALGNAMGQVDVWHGSPHSFDRFSMDKIGTGEGHQAFGHGLYFTDLVDVAKHYAKNLGRPARVTVDGKPMITTIREAENNSVLRDTLAAAKGGGFDNINEAIKYAKDSYAGNSVAKKKIKEAVEFLKSGRVDIGMKGGNVYKATLHKGKNPSEYTYLDWDKPLSEQPEKIQKFFGYDGTPRVNKEEMRDSLDLLIDNTYDLYQKERVVRRSVEKYLKEPGKSINRKMMKHYFGDDFEALEKRHNKDTGESLYRELGKKHYDKLEEKYAKKLNELEQKAQKTGKNKDWDKYNRLYEEYEQAELNLIPDREASLELLNAGIDGIRYPQGSLSGGSGQGKNYVVFDENAITIEERKALGR
jgi:hypothetical protein